MNRDKKFYIDREAYLKNQVLGMCNGVEPLRGGCIKDFFKTTACTAPDVVSSLPVEAMINSGRVVKSTWDKESIKQLHDIMFEYHQKRLDEIKSLMKYRQPNQAIGVIVKDFSHKCLSLYHLGLLVYVTEDDGNVCNVSIPYEDGGDVTSPFNCHSTIVCVPCCHVRIIEPSMRLKMGGLYRKCLPIPSA